MVVLVCFLEAGRNIRRQPDKHRTDRLAMDAHRGRVPLTGFPVLFRSGRDPHVESPRYWYSRQSVSGDRLPKALVAAVERPGRLAGGIPLFHDPGQGRRGQRWAAPCLGRVDRNLAGVLAGCVCR